MENVLYMPISPIVVSLVLITMVILGLLLSNKRKAQQTNNQIETKIEPTQEAIIEKDQIAPEIIAVIAAAVATTMETSNRYQIKTIKRIDNNLNWKMISRFEQNHTKI